MELSEEILEHFAFQQALYHELATVLAPAIAAAAEPLAATVIAGKRVWCVADEPVQHLAAHFVRQLWCAPHRPPLAVALLPLLSPDAAENGQPIDVLLQPQDVLVLLVHVDTAAERIVPLLAAARECACPSLVVGANDALTLHPAPDVLLALPADLPSTRRDELWLFLVHNLLEAWERLLLGEP